MSQFTFHFEWDTDKARINQTKHGVSFRLAMSVLRDPFAITMYDEEHSEYEERWLTLGLANNGQHLVVVHTMTQTSPTSMLVRIISARAANSAERHDYMEMPR